MYIYLATDAIEKECFRARAQYPQFHSAHEGYAVLLEEVEELWDEVKKSPKKRDPAAMREEAIQVAAMALRFLVDVCDNPPEINE
jgi:NTP pyrophosphatase (non-canonical NTP hydrolase)